MEANAERMPLWRRIANFPLVALVIAVALFVIVIVFSVLQFQLLRARGQR